MTLEEIIDSYPDEEFLKADGFDDAIIGVEPLAMRLVYDRMMMIDILVERDEMGYGEAIEYLSHNTWCAYMGDKTPLYINI